MPDPQSTLNPQASHVILTPDQRLRVFVSSTLQELAEERVAAKEAITRLRLTPLMFELVARVGWALWYFWWNRGYHSEAGQWMQAVISKEEELPGEVRGRAMFAASVVRFAQADFTGTLSLKDRMIDFMRAAGDRRGEALALTAYGLVYTHLQDAEPSAALLEQGLALYRELDDKWGLAAEVKQKQYLAQCLEGLVGVAAA